MLVYVISDSSYTFGGLVTTPEVENEHSTDLVDLNLLSVNLKVEFVPPSTLVFLVVAVNGVEKSTCGRI